MIRIALVLVALTLPAHADWQFTRWGMTIDEVVTASKGNVARTSPATLKKNRMELGLGHAYARGTYSTGDFGFTSYFYAPSGKLSGVRLLLRDAPANHRLLNQLTSVYGKPIEASASSLAGCTLRSARWNDKSAGNVVLFSAMTGCQSGSERLEFGAVLYTPLASKGGSGL